MGLSERSRLKLVFVIAFLALGTIIAYISMAHTTFTTTLFAVSLIIEIALGLSLSVTKGIGDEEDEHEHVHDAF